MAKSDIIIGFERKPENLEDFLEKQGYIAVPDEDNTIQTYEHREEGWPEVSYSSQISGENKCPDWRESGYTVTSEFVITSPVDDFDAVDEALRLSEEIVREFDGILYDIDLDEFFRKGDLQGE